ncbi:retrovirus-related pol polyprotein from transposon TNT 1-94 [Tanacetum coccineum]
MSPLSTSTNPLTKPLNQWSPEDKKLANQDKRLKSIIISCLPNDVMKFVIKCTTAKAIWTDLILAYEGPSDTRDTKIVALRLIFNAFKALEGEKVQGTYTRLKVLLNDLENKCVSIPQAEVNAMFATACQENSDSHVEEDTKSSSDFMDNLNAKFHDRALLANQKIFYKRYGRVGLAKSTIDKSKETCFACAEIVVLTKKIDDMSKGKSEKGLVAESFDYDEESVSSKDEGVTMVKAFMAIAEDEPSILKVDARSGQWVEITMKKVQRLLSMTDGDERKHVLDYAYVNLLYVEDQRKNLLSKFNSLNQELSSYKSELADLKNTNAINCSLQNEITILNLENESQRDKISDLKKVIEKWTSIDEITEPIEKPVKPQTISHNNYTLVIVDEYSRYTWVFFLKKKSDAAGCIMSFVRKMENINEVRVKELRSDNGIEFRNHKLEEVYDEKGISQNLSSPCTPEQNSIAERRNRTLIEATRTMLNSANLPKQF